MSLRTIMLFPEFNNMDKIQMIRNKFDPLANLVMPHITLVFPFESSMSNKDLQEILETALYGMKPFEIELSGFGKQQDRFGNYLFLNITKGADEVVCMHNQLYNGKLKEFDLGYPYTPHLTVGKFQSLQELEEAYCEVVKCKDIFKTVIHKISVEIVGENEESIIIIEKNLK